MDGGWGWEEDKHNQEGYDEEESKKMEREGEGTHDQKGFESEKSTRITDLMNKK